MNPFKVSGGGITLSGLGNVILGIFNGQKHLPHRDSKVTQVLRECLGSLTCQVRTSGLSDSNQCLLKAPETMQLTQLQILLNLMKTFFSQATMLAHVSPDPAHYSETLHTVQLASRLHR